MSLNYIVTTTINEPTRATIEFCKKIHWNFIIVGDLKTPHQSYLRLMETYSNVIYLTPEYQEKTYKELSDAIGWNTIQRRNIGFVEAYKRGANIMATVDDDNIPYANWGLNYIGQNIEVDLYEPVNDVFDPLSITKDNYLWHRGYPLEYLETKNNVQYVGKTKRMVLIQADLWDGDPDIDAMARLTFKPIVKYSDIKEPYCSNKISPFNSQNTFLAREVIPYYTVLPFVGRMDDIWGGYMVQQRFPNSIIYNTASVYQDRNPQNLVTNLENEIIGYKNTLAFIKNLNLDAQSLLPERTLKFYNIYRKQF